MGKNRSRGNTRNQAGGAAFQNRKAKSYQAAVRQKLGNSEKFRAHKQRSKKPREKRERVNEDSLSSSVLKPVAQICGAFLFLLLLGAIVYWVIVAV